MNTVNETPTFTKTFLCLLQALARGRANLTLRCRTRDGVGVVPPLIVRPAPEVLSPPLLEILEDQIEIRSQIVTTESDGRPVELTAVAVLFRLPAMCSAETHWRHAVDTTAAAKIRAVLAGFPLAPSFTIDAGPEFVCLWGLDVPLAVQQDPAVPLTLLQALAVRLGADMDAARSLSTLYPVSGIIRNWGDPPERMGLSEVAESPYSAEALRQAAG